MVLEMVKENQWSALLWGEPPANDGFPSQTTNSTESNYHIMTFSYQSHARYYALYSRLGQRVISKLSLMDLNVASGTVIVGPQ